MQIVLYVLVAFVGCFGLTACDRSANSSDRVSRSQEASSAEPSLLPNNQETVSPQPSLSWSKVFDTVLPLLRAKTEVPLRLPRYLATENETQPLYANIAS